MAPDVGPRNVPGRLKRRPRAAQCPKLPASVVTTVSVLSTDESVATIVKAGKVAGALANDANLDQALASGVRFIGTSWEPWIGSAARSWTQRAAGGRRPDA